MFRDVLNIVYKLYKQRNDKVFTYWIAMENIFHGMSADVITYDLKGSELKRWNKKTGRQTLLDTNYRIDRNGEPLPIDHYSNKSKKF